MKTWLRRHKNAASAILIGLLALIIVVSGILPIYSNLRMLQGKIVKSKAELTSLENKVLLTRSLDPAILEERVKTLDRALPPSKDVLLYLASIDGLSRELGLAFGGITLVPGELSEATASGKKALTKSGLQSLETEIKMRGGKESVYGFLKTIESVLPLMQIKDIKVSATGGDQYSLNLVLAMLFAEPQTIDLKGQVSLFGAEEEKYFEQLAKYRQFESVESSVANFAPKQDLFAEPIPQQ